MAHTKGEKSQADEFPCEFCDKSFSRRRSYRQHVFSHSVKGRPFKCQACSASYKSKYQLASHFQHLHDPSHVSRFQCIFCDKTLPRQYILERHLREHTQEAPYFCKFCPRECRRKDTLKGHHQTHVSGRAKSNQCIFCEKNFFSNGTGTFKRHIRVHIGERYFECEVCDMTFATPAALQNHNRKHTKETPFKCHKCGRQFSWQSARDTHIRKCKGSGLGAKKEKKLYQCEFCKKQFISQRKDMYDLHVQRHTVQGKHFQCEICHAMFQLGYDLKMHHKNIHCAKFECIFCAQKCSKKSTLEKHILVHTKERFYFCKLCPQELTTKMDLRRHLKTHEPNRSRPFKCDLCDMQCLNKYNLEAHIQQVHLKEKPYGCDECDYSARTLSGLRNHKLQHSNERPHECQKCQKKFKKKECLKLHLKRHTGERKFCCEICEKRFYNSSELQRHMKIH